MMRISEDVLALVLRALRDRDRVRVASVSRTLREIVKRCAARIALKTTGDPTACLLAWPSATKLTIVNARPYWPSVHNITDLTLTDTDVVGSMLPRSLRSLTLIRCVCQKLPVVAGGPIGPRGPSGPIGPRWPRGTFVPTEPPSMRGPAGAEGASECACPAGAEGLESLVELTIVDPKVTPDFGAVTALHTVALEGVSFRCLDSLVRLTGLRSLSITSPIPCAAHPLPIVTVGSLTSLTSLTLRGVDALNVQLHGLKDMRLERISIEMCMVCGDDPFLLVPSVAAREPHDCGAYTRRIDLRRPRAPRAPLAPRAPRAHTDHEAPSAESTERTIDAIARAAELCEYERYVHRRLACPLIAHMHGLSLLFHANLAQFDEAYRYALRCTLPIVGIIE